MLIQRYLRLLAVVDAPLPLDPVFYGMAASAVVLVEALINELKVGGRALPLDYRFEPGHPDDGVALTVPLEWQEDIDRRFPLIVIFDSQNKRSHGYMLRTIDYLTSNEQMPASVIVTSSCLLKIGNVTRACRWR